MPDSEEVPEVAKVAYRAPPLWKSDVELRFLQVESGFVYAHIVSDITKFHVIVSALDSEILLYVRDIVIKNPESNPYTVLKYRIVKHC